MVNIAIEVASRNDNAWLELQESLQTQSFLFTTACCVQSNIHGLINTSCIRYHTTIDPSHSPSPAVQKYHTRTSVSVEIPYDQFSTVISSSHSNNCIGDPGSIGEEPVP